MIEEKVDESIQSNYDQDDTISSPSYYNDTVKKLQNIVEKTSKCQEQPMHKSNCEYNEMGKRIQCLIDRDDGNQSNEVYHHLPILQPSSSSSRERGTIPFLPTLSIEQTAASSPSLLPAPSERSYSSKFRSFRGKSRRQNIETQDNNSNSRDILMNQDFIENVMYEKAAALSNTRPESSFSVYNRRNNSDSDDDEDLAAFFDGAVANGTPVANSQVSGLGGGSGTIQHLACALDSPFGLALVLTMGSDVSSRHTAFRRLITHEAACCNSPNCLRLLLEIGKNKTPSSGKVISDKTYLQQGCQDEKKNLNYGDVGYPVKRQKSNNCLVDLGKSGAKTEQINKMPFISFLEFAMGLVKEIQLGKISEIDAARILLSKGTLSATNKAILSVICNVDDHKDASLSRIFSDWISYSRISNVDGHGNTALHWAAFKNAAPCVTLLLDFGANPNAVAQSTGWTPLHDAAYSDSADAIAILVRARADVNSKAHSGATPLCFAAQEDSPNAIRLLLDAGADATIRCCESGPQGIQNSHVHIYAHEFLPQQLSQQPSRFSGYTPLHYCAHYNSHRAAVILLEHNIKLIKESKSLFDIQDLNNKIPLQIVAERGSSDVMRELLHYGVHVDCNRNMHREGTRNSDSREIAIVATDESLENTQITELEAPLTPNVMTESIVVTPMSSPLLRSLIPTEPVNSSKPWNCLSQNAIDECKQLLVETELSWSPRLHYIFTPNDRKSIVEVLKVGVRLNSIPREIWLSILDFCGREWFDPNSSKLKAI